ncbi:MAG: hypothetical protein U0625_03955 [Phycisphaerales bacterium]
MKLACIALVATASLASAADAGFTGWVGMVRNTGTHILVDVYAGMSASTDKLLNAFNMNIALSNGVQFVQGSTAATNKWRPTLGVANIDDIDSFVTMGGYNDGGVWYCGDATTPDPNFTNYATANATTIPPNAGWFSSVPNSPQIVAIPLLSQPGFITGGSDSASFGVWIAHFAFARDVLPQTGFSIMMAGSAAFNSGTNTFDQRNLWITPAPGALALLGLAGLAPRRRRS